MESLDFPVALVTGRSRAEVRDRAVSNGDLGESFRGKRRRARFVFVDGVRITFGSLHLLAVPPEFSSKQENAWGDEEGEVSGLVFKGDHGIAYGRETLVLLVQ